MNDDRAVLDKTVGDQVSMWKSRQGLTDTVVADHACSGETCSYHQIGDAFVCEKTGNIHGMEYLVNSWILFREWKRNEAENSKHASLLLKQY